MCGELETGMAEMCRGLAAKQETGAQLKAPYYLGLMAGVGSVREDRERWFEHRLWGEQLLRGSQRRFGSRRC